MLVFGVRQPRVLTERRPLDPDLAPLRHRRRPRRRDAHQHHAGFRVLPGTRRASLVTLMFCGFTIGSALGGLIASQVLERYGWRPLLVGGGIAPLLLAPVLWWALPESVRYLVIAGAAGTANRRRALEDCPRRRSRRCDIRGSEGAGHLAGAATLLGRAHDRHAAAVARVLHEPPRRLSAVELDADPDPAKHRSVAEPCRAGHARCCRSAARSARSSSAG